MKHGVIFVLLDAFRPDYLDRSRFLKKLSRRTALGELEEPFGFIPRPAYFGGLTPSQYGATNMFLRDPESSPFAMAKFLPEKEIINEKEARIAILKQAKRYFTDFEAAYASTLDIPLEKLAEFSLAEKAPPWSEAAGYRSLFHILDEAKTPWYQCSWPYTQLMANHSDGSIMGKALEALDGSHGFAFVHLSGLDTTGHQYGPGSVELQQELLNTDALCSLLIEHLGTVYTSFDCLFFGDHGMLSVRDTFDVQAMLDTLGPATGEHFSYFIDSTLVRFWFETNKAKKEVSQLFIDSEKGHWLTENEGRKYGIFGINPKNGEAYFLARPGVVFHPNFFQGQGRPPRGMHGYAPDIDDNRGLFMLYQSKIQQPRQAGIVKAEQLFPLALELCGIKAEKYTKVPPPNLEKERYPEHVTYQALPATDEKILNEIESIGKSIHDLIPESEGVLLAGSFGRGEGAIKQQQGQPQAMNDYDFVAFGNGLKPEAIESFCKKKPVQIGIDFLDVGLLPFPPHNTECSQFNYDYKYGSRILRGNPLLLDAFPDYAPEEILAEDGLLQLANRICGLMLYPAHTIWEDGPLKQPIINQIVKTLIALGDTYLIHWKDYASSYKTRGNRFASLAHIEALSIEETSLIFQAYQYKLMPQNTDTFRCGDILEQIAHLVLKTLNKIFNRNENIEELCQSLTQALPLSRVNPLEVFHQKIIQDSSCSLTPHPSLDPRLLTYKANLLLFFGMVFDKASETYNKKAAQLLQDIGFITGKTASSLSPEKLRLLANHAWNAATH
mgnify:CR=1 FL=1